MPRSAARSRPTMGGRPIVPQPMSWVIASTSRTPVSLLSDFKNRIPNVACPAAQIAPTSISYLHIEVTGMSVGMGTAASAAEQPSSSGMAGIDVLRRLLVALRRHLGRIGRTGDTAGTQLFALAVFLGTGWLDAVRLRRLGHR